MLPSPSHLRISCPNVPPALYHAFYDSPRRNALSCEPFCKIYCNSFWLKSWDCGEAVGMSSSCSAAYLSAAWECEAFRAFKWLQRLPSTRPSGRGLPLVGEENIVDCLFCHVLFMPFRHSTGKGARETCLHKWNDSPFISEAKHFCPTTHKPEPERRKTTKWINWCSNSDCEKFKLLIQRAERRWVADWEIRTDILHAALPREIPNLFSICAAVRDRRHGEAKRNHTKAFCVALRLLATTTRREARKNLQTKNFLCSSRTWFKIFSYVI